MSSPGESPKPTDAPRGPAKLRVLATWLIRRIGLLVLVVLAVAAGFGLRAWLGPDEAPAPPADSVSADGQAHDHTEAEPDYYCPMHPHIRSNEPGQCSICGMDLVLAAEETTPNVAGEPVLTVTPAAAALMNVETAPVRRQIVAAEVNMVGRVDYDETRLAYITARVPGRLDRLYVDYTGVPVREGDHLVWIYSPELLTAQQELLQARLAVEQISQSDSEMIRRSTEATYESAREKLQLLGLTAEQIEQVESAGQPSDHLTIYSPAAGIVVDKNAREGMYVQTGTRIYTIADLSRVWVLLEAYESDVAWLRYGQEIEFTVTAYPGEVFGGRIAFIDPVLDRRTRTVAVRVNVDNADGRLKPGMYVRATAFSRVAEGGRVIDADLAGKWVSPMHPEIVKDEPGFCDVCGMPLVPAERLGFVAEDDGQVEPPLVIPATAPLITGRRAVVYRQREEAEQPTFEAVDVVLGPRAGDFYIVREGLREGQRVVTRGAFQIDSALQIRRRPSMMAPGEQPGLADEPEPPATARAANPAFAAELAGLYDGYFGAAEALAADDLPAAKAAAAEALQDLDAVDMTLLTGQAHMDWMDTQADLAEALGAIVEAEGVEPARSQFALLSELMVALAERFGPPEGTVYQMQCPMAFDNRGARWLQSTDVLNNPYFGEVMLRCGEIQREFSADRPGAEGEAMQDDSHEH